MAKHSVDFDADKIGPREARTLLPRGQYLLEVLAADEKVTAQAKGSKPYFDLSFRVVEAAHAPHVGVRVRQNLNMPPAGSDEKAVTQQRMFTQFWKAIEPKATGQSFDTDDWIGKRVVADIDHEHGTMIATSTGQEVQTVKNKISAAYPKDDWHGGFLRDPCKTCAGQAIAAAKVAQSAKTGADIPFGGAPASNSSSGMSEPDPELGDMEISP